MPTLDDLHAALADRECFAGDPDTVLAALDNPSNRRHILPPLLAATAVAGLAVGGAVLAVGPDATHTSAGGRTDPSAWISAGVSDPPTSAPPATTAPPGAHPQLTWNFSVSPVEGYRFDRFTWDARAQQAKITRPDDVGWTGFVTVYSPGETPKSLARTGDGQAIQVDGHDGVFLAGTAPGTASDVDDPDIWPRLLWHYRDDAWVEVQGPFGMDAAEHTYDDGAARAAELQIGASVDVAASDPITAPFAVEFRPAGLDLASAQTGAFDCIGFDLAGQPQLAVQDDLTVCRVAGSRVALVPRGDDDRIATHAVGDGTVIVAVQSAAHLDFLDDAGLQSVADQVVTTPAMDDPSTWLPVR